jgi:hypothetical protein
MTERRTTESPGRLSGTDQVDVRTERTGEGTVYRAEPRPAIGPAAEVAYPRPPVRDRIQWGPVVAGVATTIATLLALTVLGLAVGLTVFDPTAAGEDVGTAAAIWAAASAVIAFFVGGWIAGTSVALLADQNGALNGFMVGAAALALLLILAASGAGNLLGGIGANIDEIARVGAQLGIDPTATAQEAQTQAQQIYDDAQAGAWATFLAIGLGLGAAAIGGLVGHRIRTRTDVTAG